jgi:predicted nuclease of restriction endonuclease-like (RecB) superfamily
MGKAGIDKNYAKWILLLKQKVQQAQLKAAHNSNKVLIDLYWELGKEITHREKEFDYGENFIEKVAVDLKHEFPDVKGFSRRNLYGIRQWYLFFESNGGVVHRTVAQLPWRHQTLLVQKFKNLDIIVLYAKSVIRHNWSRDILEANIKNNYHLRLGKADHNFEISDSDYFIDLLFYHLHLRCYVVIEIKAGKFRPEYTGKLNFYLSAIDSQLRHSTDNPSIGIILCRTKDKIEVEYALRDINKPIGVSAFELSSVIPEELKIQLPTVEELETRFL